MSLCSFQKYLKKNRKKIKTLKHTNIVGLFFQDTNVAHLIIGGSIHCGSGIDDQREISDCLFSITFNCLKYTNFLVSSTINCT